MTKEEIIEKRKAGGMKYEEAKELQKQLIKVYKKEYAPKHSADVYLKLILKEDVSEIKKRHPQEDYHPEMVFTCFSCVSQHVYGYTKEHCLDQIYDEVKSRKKRIKKYKKLPTLKEFVDSGIEVEPEKTYYTKEKGDHKDSCSGYGGSDIIEMREVGIEEYKRQSFKEFVEWFNGG